MMKLLRDRSGRVVVEMVLIIASLMVIGLLVSTQTPAPKAAFVAHTNSLTPPAPTPPITQREPEITPVKPEQAPAATPAPVAPQKPSGTLGSLTGWALPYGNCVDVARAWGKNQPGNPSSWRVSSQTPWVGAAMLFPGNHVAIVVGIDWNRGVVIVQHKNWRGGQFVFPISYARGYA